jgi:hypothetical protein
VRCSLRIGTVVRMSRTVPLDVLVRCDQNRLFGCGATCYVPAILLKLYGSDLVKVVGGGNCSRCSLPLAVCREARATERALYEERVKA